MIRYECDKCGAALGANDLNRFIVKMEIYAAAGPIELDPNQAADTETELRDLLERLKHADPNEVEDRTYRAFRFDVCDACRGEMLRRPLG